MKYLNKKIIVGIIGGAFIIGLLIYLLLVKEKRISSSKNVMNPKNTISTVDWEINQPVPYKALKIVLYQDENYNLSVKSVGLTNSNPDEFKLNLLSNFYTVELVDRNDVMLFSGKFISKKIIMPGPPLAGQDPGYAVTQPLGEIVLYLPYYQNAQKILIRDEKGIILLTIDLTQYL